MYLQSECPSHQTIVKTHHCKTLTEWVVFTKLFSTQSVVGSSLNSSSKCWAKCVSLYYLWVAAPTNLVVSATGLTLPTFPTLSRATSTQPIGSGVWWGNVSDTECEDEPRNKQARTLDTTPHYITVKAGSLRYSCIYWNYWEKEEIFLL